MKQAIVGRGHQGVTDTWLHHIKRKAYEVGFEEWKALVAQILLVDKVHLLQIPILTISNALAIL